MHVGKKTLSALMALTLTASLAACSASTPADTPPSENLVQTSNTPSVDEEGAKRTEYPLTITTYNYNKEPVEYTFAKAPERVYAYPDRRDSAVSGAGRPHRGRQRNGR